MTMMERRSDIWRRHLADGFAVAREKGVTVRGV
jgi:hypothetical protein